MTEFFSQDDIVKKITKIILTNKQKMIREDDLRNLCSDSLDFNQIISDVYISLKNIGFELITSKFLDNKYYVLTANGKDDNISPSQYGTLALIIALSKETNENMKLSDLKEMFEDVWTSDVEFLIKEDYLRKIKLNNLDIIKVTPLGKAIMKNIIQDLKIKKLFEVFKDKE
ncbi:MAG: hypothetical protein ACTSPD_03410 [Promethearchaeota archaeon]